MSMFIICCCCYTMKAICSGFVPCGFIIYYIIIICCICCIYWNIGSAIGLADCAISGSC